MSEGQPVKPVAFLDTNTLHQIEIYLEHANTENLYPFLKKEDAIDESRRSLTDLSDNALSKALRRGLETIFFLSEEDIQIEYAPISEIELLTGRIRGAAIISAAKEGVPYRMWSRFREEEIRERIDSTELAHLRSRVEKLSSVLEHSGIAITASGRDRARDVLELAKGIIGLVYMDAVDSLIYSSSLIAEADYLITGDGYLRGTVNNIHSPDGQARYETVRLKLTNLVHRMMVRRTPEDGGEVTLPRAFTVSVDGRLEPPLPSGS